MTAAKTLIVGLVTGIIALGTIKEMKTPRKGGGLITTINDLNIPQTYGISAEKLARQTGLYHQPIYLSDEFIITNSEQGDTFWIQRIFGYKSPRIISKVPLGLPLKGISKTANSFLLGLEKLDPFPAEQEQDSAITPDADMLASVQPVAMTTAEEVAPVTTSENFLPEGIKTLRYGAQGKYVTKLHISLENKGYQINRLEIESQFFGKTTELSVRDVQRKSGFAIDGVVGERTMIALGLRRGIAPPQNNVVTSSKKETPQKDEKAWKPQIPTVPIQQPVLPERKGKTLKKSLLTASK